jgi:hypothetical protein
MLNNTIVAENSSAIADIWGFVDKASSYDNIIGNAPSDGGLDNGINGNQTGVNPFLLPLGNYGGPTQAMPPAFGSPAINAGSVYFVAPGETDQRGFSRVSGNGADVDIGAVEVQPGGLGTHLELQGSGTAVPGSVMTWTATVLDDNNLPAVNFSGPVIISIASGPGNFTSNSTTDINAPYGTAVFNDLTLETPGYYTIQASFGNSTISEPLMVTGGQLGSIALSEGNAPAILMVNTLTDPASAPTSGNFLSLREAIEVVDAGTTKGLPAVELNQITGTLGDDDTIVFAPAVFGETGTINLTASLPEITTSVQILGPGPNQLTINGGGKYQFFVVAPSAWTVSFSGLTLADGFGVLGGGAIFMGNTDNEVPTDLTVSDCTFFNNDGGQGGEGGAIYGDGESIAVTHSTFTDNFAPEGGAVYSYGGIMNLSNVTFSGNEGDVDGAIYNYDTALYLSNDTFTGNYGTVNSEGGSVYNYDDVGNPMIVTNCSFTYNAVYNDGLGGAIYNDGTMNIEGCTFAFNTAGESDGGAVFMNSSSGIILNSTFADNSATGSPASLASGNGGALEFLTDAALLR